MSLIESKDLGTSASILQINRTHNVLANLAGELNAAVAC